MNYEFYWDGKPWDMDDIPIGHIFRDEWQRPQVGMEIKIKGKLVRVTRTDPTTNPSNTMVKYYVEPVNGNWQYKNK